MPGWSIGIYAGPSPLALAPPPEIDNPVLTAADVTDVPAGFVADPFLLRRDGRWHLFCEVLNRESGRGEIALATSGGGRSWSYERVVLREPFHLSFPHVFSSGDDVFLLPETLNAGALRLYRAIDFPDRWELAGELVRGDFADPVAAALGGALVALRLLGSLTGTTSCASGSPTSWPAPGASTREARWSPATAAAPGRRGASSPGKGSSSASPRTATRSTAPACGPSRSWPSIPTSTGRRRSPKARS